MPLPAMLGVPWLVAACVAPWPPPLCLCVSPPPRWPPLVGFRVHLSPGGSYPEFLCYICKTLCPKKSRFKVLGRHKAGGHASTHPGLAPPPSTAESLLLQGVCLPRVRSLKRPQWLGGSDANPGSAACELCGPGQSQVPAGPPPPAASITFSLAGLVWGPHEGGHR